MEANLRTYRYRVTSAGVPLIPKNSIGSTGEFRTLLYALRVSFNV